MLLRTIRRCRSRKIEVTTASCFYVRAVLFSFFFSDEKKFAGKKRSPCANRHLELRRQKKWDGSVSHLVSVVGSRRRTPVKSYTLYCTALETPIFYSAAFPLC